ncbi:MAG: hypothetical protein HEP71_10760 [Roseivirga sp.]|nr:hypothetical protein [Roseivirga sp.]
MSGSIWQWVYLGLRSYPLVGLSDSPQITAHELARLEDRDFLLTKRVIDEKVTALLLATQQRLSAHIIDKDITLPDEISLNPRKVAKGENYQSLPYWVCDFPASLNKTDIWTFRIVVWWGKEVSLNLILKGKFKQECAPLSPQESSDGIFYSTHSDPWILELDAPTSLKMTPENETNIVNHFQTSDFLKLSQSLQLNEINNLAELSVISFDKLLAMINYLA